MVDTGLRRALVARPRARHGVEGPALLDVRAVVVVTRRLTRVDTGDRVPPVRPDRERGGADRAHAQVDSCEGHRPVGEPGAQGRDEARPDPRRWPLACSEIPSDEKGTTGAGFLARAAAYFAEHGIAQIERVMTDTAFAHRYSSALRDVLATLGAWQALIRPHCPWQNGKVERLEQTLATEWACRQMFTSDDRRKAALAPWLEYCSTRRRRSALGGLPPLSRRPPTSRPGTLGACSAAYVGSRDECDSRVVGRGEKGIFLQAGRLRAPPVTPPSVSPWTRARTSCRGCRRGPGRRSPTDFGRLRRDSARSPLAAHEGLQAEP